MAIREIGTAISADASQFKKELSAVNSNLSGLQSEMKAVTAEFADQAQSADALAAKDKILSQQEEQQRVKVEALSQAYEDQAKATGENSVEADRLRKQLNNARADLAKTTRAHEENTAALTKARDEARRSAQILERVKTAYADLRKAAAKLQPALKAGEKATAAAAKAVTALYTASVAATGAVVTLGVSGIKTLTGYAVEAANAKDSEGNPLYANYAQLAENLTGLQAASDKAKAALGSVLLPALTSLSGRGGKLLESFSAEMEAAQGDTGKMGEIMSRYIVEAVAVLRDELPQMVRMGTDLLSGLVEGAGEALPEVVTMAEELVSTLLDGLESAAPTLGPAAVDLVLRLVEDLAAASPQLITSAFAMVTKLVTGLTNGDTLQRLVGAAGDIVEALITGIAENGPDLFLAAGQLVFDLAAELIGKAAEMLGVGQEVVDKLKEGISGAWQGLVDFVKGLWDALKSAFEAGLTVPIAMGEVPGAVPGYATGLDYVPRDNFAANLHRGEMVLDRAQADAYRRGGSGTTVNLTVYTQDLSEAQVNDLVRVINDKLGDDT